MVTLLRDEQLADANKKEACFGGWRSQPGSIQQGVEPILPIHGLVATANGFRKICEDEIQKEKPKTRRNF